MLKVNELAARFLFIGCAFVSAMQADAQVKPGEMRVVKPATEYFKNIKAETAFPGSKHLSGQRIMVPVVMPLSVTAEIQNAFDTYTKARQARSDNTLLGQLNLPPFAHDIDSALDVVGSPLLEEAMENAVSDFLGEKTIGLSVSAIIMILLIGHLDTSTIVEFPDGSTMEFMYTATQPGVNNSETVFVVTTDSDRTRDAQGNPVPYQQSDIVSLNLSSPDPNFIENWLNLMQRLGVQVLDRSPLGTSTGGDCEKLLQCEIRRDDEGQPQRFCEISLQDC